MNAKEVAPNEVQLAGAGTDTPSEKGIPMNTIVGQAIADFSTRFDLATRHARIAVEPEKDYWRRYGDARTSAPSAAGDSDLVRLTDDQDAHLLLAPAEALSVAAALSAVATHLLEEPRKIRRRTEPGQPDVDGVGGGL